MVGEESIRRDLRLSGLIGEDFGMGSGVSVGSEVDGDGEDFDFFEGFGGSRAMVDPMDPFRRPLVDFFKGKMDPELAWDVFTTDIERSWFTVCTV